MKNDIISIHNNSIDMLHKQLMEGISSGIKRAIDKKVKMPKALDLDSQWTLRADYPALWDAMRNFYIHTMKSTDLNLTYDLVSALVAYGMTFVWKKFIKNPMYKRLDLVGKMKQFMRIYMGQKEYHLIELIGAKGKEKGSSKPIDKLEYFEKVLDILKDYGIKVYDDEWDDLVYTRETKSPDAMRSHVMSFDEAVDAEETADFSKIKKMTKQNEPNDYNLPKIVKRLSVIFDKKPHLLAKALQDTLKDYYKNTK